MSEEELRSNPYVGLRPFFNDDSLYFYGRDQQIEELLAILRENRFLGVVGSSGSGKSSLVRAGLLPGLLGGFLVQDRDSWRIAQFKPGDAPMCNLCAGLLDAMEIEATAEDRAIFEQNVRDGHTRAVVEFLRTRLESNANLFLLVDQFEEIFAFRGLDEDETGASFDLQQRAEMARRKAEATDFVDLLLSLAGQRDLPIYVAITMRTDFLGECDLFHRLPEALNSGRYLVPRMNRTQLRDAVECPALLLGAQVAPRLLDSISNELGDRFDRLPVLQHALLRTWDEWEQAGGIGPIDLQHFKSSGGLAGSLAQDAEAALAGLDVDLTASVFKRLTDTDLSRRRIRSPARISELMIAANNADRASIELILHRFEENGRSFVNRSADGKPDDPRIDISHESLIRQWGRLRNWVDEERRSRDQYKELVARAGKYALGDVALLQHPELQIAIDWLAIAAPSPGWAQRYSNAKDEFDNAKRYIEDSLQTRCRGLAERELRRRWLSVWARLVIVIEVIIGTFLVSKFSPLMIGEENGLLVRGGDILEKILVKFEIREGFGELFDMAFDENSALFTLFLLACVQTYIHAERYHRKRSLPLIMADIESRGGHLPAMAKELPDAKDAKTISYAIWSQRLKAWTMDALLQGLIAFCVLLVWTTIVSLISLQASDTVTSSDEANFMLYVALVFFNWLACVLPLSSKSQATPGMRIVGIYRVDRFGRRLSFSRATAWYFCRYLSLIFYFLGFAIQPFMPKKQTFHDWVAGTVVLEEPPQVTAPTVRRVAPRKIAPRDPG